LALRKCAFAGDLARVDEAIKYRSFLVRCIGEKFIMKTFPSVVFATLLLWPVAAAAP
jgi:hypothetical protein